jgi:L-rhamnose isomerase
LLDEIYAVKTDPRYNRDSMEGKLFGLGLESYTVGSHEFYLGYAIANHLMICLDTGHFHPTETVADKISAVMLYLDELLLHISRGVRWDSDHVVTLSEELLVIAQELVRGEYLERVHLGLDYFDASINRVAAWVIGARGVLRAAIACSNRLNHCARSKSPEITARLALLEEFKS